LYSVFNLRASWAASSRGHAASDEGIALTSLVDQLLPVSDEELDRRMVAYKAEADKNPEKRGPEPDRVSLVVESSVATSQTGPASM